MQRINKKDIENQIIFMKVMIGYSIITILSFMFSQMHGHTMYC